jgi:hypothetical protein
MTAAAFEEGWRPKPAQQLEIHYVEAASLGEHRGGCGLMLGIPGLWVLGFSLILP